MASHQRVPLPPWGPVPPWASAPPYPWAPPARPVPPPVGVVRPERIEPIAGTSFAVAYPAVSPTLSGFAVGSMVAGIGSELVSLLVYALGLAGAPYGWGPLVAGAFAILSALAGLAALGTGLVAMRQVRRAPAESRGRGLAVAGVACGGSGLVLTLLGFLLVVLVSRGS